ncbi:DNA topoisomerase IV alpha subunit [Phanerochaete sordida]|uniref:DNA topoisomerase (ATP-hydrolyzing) n=1 Tax=Phanerochaete sordida TaxID=48140 RepID=A0A9P3LHF0_9APHY|nr:DNA topoisomerase IV alpha subunit [Phanerochaete sordida]
MDSCRLEDVFASDNAEVDMVDPAGGPDALPLGDTITEDTAEVQDDENEDALPEGMDEDSEGEDDSRLFVISGLEALILTFLRQVSKAFPSPDDSGSWQSRSKVTLSLADRRKPPQEDGTASMRQLVFPLGSKHPGTRAIAQVMKALDLMHEAVVTGVPTTKRDMYYKDVPLFGSQAVINKLVDDIAATLGVRRADLNVRASSKGLVSGKGLTIYIHNTDEPVTINPAENTLIPLSEEIERFEVDDDLSWVLVIEKEAVYQTICRLNLAEHPDLPGPGLLITGKGYPDLATRQLVSTLSENLPHSVPIIALVDCDPYGLDIMSVYKYGSASMTHENESLVAPRVTWGGLRSSDISTLGLTRDAMILLTKHDHKKALSILRRDNLPRKWKKELQHMLHSHRKAEIEILSTTDATASSQQTSSEEAMEDEPRQLSTNTLLDYVVSVINQGIYNATRNSASQ